MIIQLPNGAIIGGSPESIVKLLPAIARLERDMLLDAQLDTREYHKSDRLPVSEN